MCRLDDEPCPVELESLVVRRNHMLHDVCLKRGRQEHVHVCTHDEMLVITSNGTHYTISSCLRALY